jgi:hypothetical protein
MLDVDSLTERLLAAEEPWVVLNTRLDLLGQSEDDSEVRSAYAALKKDGKVGELLDEVKIWPQPQRLGRAYDPKDSLWKLSMLADFGLKRDDKRVASVAEKVFDNQAAEPAPPGFLHGGFDHTKSWDKRPYICISHVMTYALARFGYLDDPRLGRAYEYIAEWQRKDGGWHPTEACQAGHEREDDPSCPFGTVNVLRAVAANPSMREGEVARRGVENVLELWERRAEPNRLQYPFVQHQLLKTVDTLSNFPAALKDSRFGEMLDAVVEKQTEDGTFKPEGVNKPYAEFDFGQKKAASPWLTFIIARASLRHERQGKAGKKKAGGKPARRKS